MYKFLLATCFHAGFLFSFFFDPENGRICSSETLVDTQRTTRRYIPEDGTLQVLYVRISLHTFVVHYAIFRT
jgi:hypothetical protein